MNEAIKITLNAAIFAVTEDTPRILTVKARPGSGQQDRLEALPAGPLDPVQDRTLEKGLRRWVFEQSGLELGYVEQLYTFGDRDRVPGQWGQGRAVSIAYLALVREGELSGREQASWKNCYDFFRWEDRRQDPVPLSDELTAGLRKWAAGAAGPKLEKSRQERIAIAFGLGGSAWDGERVLHRYELLYEAGLIQESGRNAAAIGDESGPAATVAGRAMALDHRRIVATALGRLRGKLKYRPVVFEMLPETFTLYQLQRLVEALAGVRLHKQNFRRLVERGGLVEGTGRLETKTGGRPAELFRFRREVLRERRAPGVGIRGT